MPLLFPSRLIDLQTDALPLRYAVLSCVAYTGSYVGSLYLFPATRTGHLDDSGVPVTRDSPSVIRARLAGVSVSSLLSLAGSAFLASRASKAIAVAPIDFASRVLGLAWPEKPWTGCLAALGLTATLFLGPLYTAYLDGALPFQSAFSFQRDVKERVLSWTGLRNYVWGPLTEELVFRSCILATSGLAHVSTSNLIWYSPLYFGIAHVHHAWDVYCKNGRNQRALVQGLLSSTFQFAYTTIFGWYASFLFLRSSSIAPPLIAHVFCNFLGFPQLLLALNSHPNRKVSIYAAYAIGIAAFGFNFLKWTDVHQVFGGSLYFA